MTRGRANRGSADEGERTPEGTGAANETIPMRVLYTPAEAAQLLTVPESWLRQQARAQVVPCVRIGKYLRFSPANLDDIAAAGAQPARSPRLRRR